MTSEIYDKFEEGFDLMDGGELFSAHKVFMSVIKEYPQFIDAYHYMALALERQGEREEAFQLWKKAVDIGFSCFPKNFKIGKDRLLWIYQENRPFLRAYHSLGLCYYERGKLDDALGIFKNLLELNPNDNQGVRGIVVEIYFTLKKPEEVLKICKRYPEDATPEILYGDPLALFQLNKNDEAEKKMKVAIRYLPLIARELINDKHKRPKDMMEGFLTIGGPDEAYDYWLRSGKFWKETPGAIEFVKECYKKYRKGD